MVCRASFQFHRHGSLRAPHMLGLYNTPKPHQKALKTPDPSSLKSPAKHRPALPTFRSTSCSQFMLRSASRTTVQRYQPTSWVHGALRGLGCTAKGGFTCRG